MNDKLRTIFDKNIAFKKLEKEYNERLNEIKAVNEEIDLIDLEELTYEELKDFYNNTNYLFASMEKHKSLRKYYDERKIKEFPMLLKPKYYKEINQLNFLTDEQKLAVDTYLGTRLKSDSMISPRSNAMYKCKLDIKTSKEVCEKLHEFGVLDKFYIIGCPCGEEFKYISKKQFENIVRLFNLDNKDISSLSDEEYSEYMDMGSITICCYNCDELEIETEEQLRKAIKGYVYKIIKEADTFFEEI